MIDKQTFFFTLGLLREKGIKAGTYSYRFGGFMDMSDDEIFAEIQRGHARRISFASKNEDWAESLAFALERILLDVEDKTGARDNAKGLLAKYGANALSRCQE